jgi:corrinoid protein of di/trimethylamine methyltransferase
MDQLLEALSAAIVEGDPEAAEAAARAGLDAGLAPLALIEGGAMPALREIGEGYECGEFFLPDLMMAARAMESAMGVLEPALAATGGAREAAGVVVLGTAKGDIHEIGKNLVGLMLAVNGFAVHDLGVDVAPARFVEKAAETGAGLVGVSALLTTTMPGQKAVIDALAAAGLRPGVAVMIGGAPVTRAWAEEIGADAYAEDAISAVDAARRLVAR